MRTKFEIGDHVEATHEDGQRPPVPVFGYVLEINISTHKNILYRIGNRWFFEKNIKRTEKENAK